MILTYAFFWYRYDSEGRGTSLASVGTGVSPLAKSGARSMYSDRVSLSYITENPSLGEDKVLHCELLIAKRCYLVKLSCEDGKLRGTEYNQISVQLL